MMSYIAIPDQVYSYLLSIKHDPNMILDAIGLGLGRYYANNPIYRGCWEY